jgi:RND family efflux transporter MFP subunit
MTTKSKQLLVKRSLVAIVAIGLVTAVELFWPTGHLAAQSSQQADNNSQMPVAGVARVGREDMYKEVQYLAEFRPYMEADLNAKVSGYVSQVNVDFGDKVKTGQLLATIEVPEIAAEFANAQAVEQKAEADYTNADLVYSRLVAVNKAHPNLVAQQQIDTAEATDHAAAAAIAAAQADAVKYRTMAGYTNIIAPFDGVITRRYTDPGQLVQSGTASGRPMFRLSDNYRLRLDFPVTVDFVKDIQVGQTIDVTVDSLNNQTFTGKIARFTYDVDDNTRKMTTEIEVPNDDLKIIPGMYAKVVLSVEKHANALAVPAQAVSSGKTPTVLVVNHNNEVEERPVALGLEMPNKYEVLSGLQEGDLVIVGNRGAFQAGEKVEPKIVELTVANQR